MPNNITLKDANGLSVVMKTTETGGVHTPSQNISGYDAVDDMVKVKSVQKKFRDSFGGAALNSAKWDSTIGSGGSVTVSSGTLAMASGTVASSTTSILSKETFTVPFRVSLAFTMSQRIANQDFVVEMVSVDPVTGIPDGQHAAALVFNSTTATQAIYRVQNFGGTALDSALSTFPTTASNNVFEIEPFADECWFHGSALDSTAGRSNSYRRHRDIPDPLAVYKLRLRWTNGGTAPASTTTATVLYVACQDYAELTAEITAGRGQSVAGQAIGVQTTNTVLVQGAIAHDSNMNGNPVRVGARAVNAAYTTVANNDAADLITTLQGVLVTRPWQIPELEWSYAAVAGGIVNTTDVVLAAAPAAGLRRYVTSIQVQNAGAVATDLLLKDGATTIWRCFCPANMPLTEISFDNPLKATAATALNAACSVTGSAIYVNAQGFTAA